jgi:hypothetical protein
MGWMFSAFREWCDRGAFQWWSLGRRVKIKQEGCFHFVRRVTAWCIRDDPRLHPTSTKTGIPTPRLKKGLVPLEEAEVQVVLELQPLAVAFSYMLNFSAHTTPSSGGEPSSNSLPPGSAAARAVPCRSNIRQADVLTIHSLS